MNSSATRYKIAVGAAAIVRQASTVGDTREPINRHASDASDEEWGTLISAVGRARDPGTANIKGSDLAAKIRISNGDLLAGDAPSKVLRQARRWVEEHRVELSAMWDELQR